MSTPLAAAQTLCLAFQPFHEAEQKQCCDQSRCSKLLNSLPEDLRRTEDIGNFIYEGNNIRFCHLFYCFNQNDIVDCYDVFYDVILLTFEYF